MALVAARFVHYAALLSLFGLSCFPTFTGTRLDGEAAGAARSSIRIAAVVGLVSGVAVFACVAAAMLGSWHELDRDGVASVAATGFGVTWIVHLALALATVGLALPSLTFSKTSSAWALMTASGITLASLAGVGHTQDGSGVTKAVHVVADVLHLLGAGAWLGGILGLFFLVAASIRSALRGDETAAIDAAIGFSGLGTAAVATLVLSGLINGWILVGSLRGLASTAYGQLLLLKLALFGAMLILAALNRYRIVPALMNTGAERTKAALGRLRRHVVAEQGLGLAVLLVVSWLGTLEPAINLKGSP